jgi:activating signal cointegrator complex subunit 3
MSSGNFFSTDIGRVASHYYIHHESMARYNKELTPFLNDEKLLHVLSSSKEFEQIKLRDEELTELRSLAEKYCPIKIKGGLEHVAGKVNVLLQAYISNGYIANSTLTSDSYYVTRSIGRITRALFELMLKRGRTYLALRMLALCKMFELRCWDFQHPLRQFPRKIRMPIVQKLEARSLTVEKLLEMEPSDIGAMVRQQKIGGEVQACCRQIPFLELSATVQPLTRSVLKVQLEIYPSFQWSDKLHGTMQPFWIWIEDGESEHIYHSEYFMLHKSKKHARTNSCSGSSSLHANSESKGYSNNKQDTKDGEDGDDEVHRMTFMVPIFEPIPAQYYVRAESDRWLGSESSCAVSFEHLILPAMHTPHTKLLNLVPLPITVLHNPKAERMYSYSHFNPIQTQVRVSYPF